MGKIGQCLLIIAQPGVEAGARAEELRLLWVAGQGFSGKIVLDANGQKGGCPPPVSTPVNGAALRAYPISRETAIIDQ